MSIFTRRGQLTGGISKFLAERADVFIAKLNLKPGSFVCMAAGKKLAAQKTAYEIITEPQLYVNSEALAKFGITLSDELAARAIEAE